MAGIANGAEWIALGKLKELFAQLPEAAIVQASPLGNIVVYDEKGPIDGQMIAYIDLLTERVEFESAEPVA